MLLVALLLLLMAINASLVAAELAMVRIRRTRLTELVDRGVAAAKHSIVCVDEMSGMLSTIQIGVTMASLAVGWIAESCLDRVLGHAAPAAWDSTWVHAIGTMLGFTLVTYVHVLFGEIVPKHFAIERAEQIMLVIARPLLVMHRILAPVRIVAVASANRLLRLLTGERPPAQPLSETELALIMQDSHAEGVITKAEVQIITRAFEFSDRCARDVMVRADDVAYLSLARDFDGNLELVKQARHARMPLCREGIDTAFAVVSMKDAWPILLEQPTNDTFAAVARPLPQVRADSTQDEVLEALRAHGTQLALVRGVAGHVAVGIVTLEDVLESLHGDLREGTLDTRATSRS